LKEKHLEFWLSWNNNAEKLRLPVLPPKLSVKMGHTYYDIDLVSVGESTIIGESQLKEYSFSSLWPEMYDPGLCDYVGFPSPEEFVATIERWKNTGWPIRFIVTGSKINTAATIRDFSYDWDGFDIEYSLSLKEYQFIHLESVKVNIVFQAPSGKWKPLPAQKSEKDKSKKKKGKRPDTKAAKVSSTKEKSSKEKLVDKYLARGKPKLK
jgi:hypothetical protein